MDTSLQHINFLLLLNPVAKLTLWPVSLLCMSFTIYIVFISYSVKIMCPDCGAGRCIVQEASQGAVSKGCKSQRTGWAPPCPFPSHVPLRHAPLRPSITGWLPARRPYAIDPRARRSPDLLRPVQRSPSVRPHSVPSAARLSMSR
ncbi:Protein of unknown function [Gryllus bimaculatus]|nr:Protein of unknown function [Gryllus bimaculatus]